MYKDWIKSGRTIKTMDKNGKLFSQKFRILMYKTFFEWKELLSFNQIKFLIDLSPLEAALKKLSLKIYTSMKIFSSTKFR